MGQDDDVLLVAYIYFSHTSTHNAFSPQEPFNVSLALLNHSFSNIRIKLDMQLRRADTSLADDTELANIAYNDKYVVVYDFGNVGS